MVASIVSLDDAAAQHWDVIVIGTGVGGGTFGYAMAKKGRRVLFCERGSAHLGNSALTGAYPEELIPGAIAGSDPGQINLLRRAGRDTDLVDDCTTARSRRFMPFIGSGIGGSSALYGMAMERFFPCDFEPRQHHPDAAGNTLPQSWPIRYEELAPWYAEAEALYRVRGTRDARREITDYMPVLAPPPELTPELAWLSSHLVASGLHPYRLPMACEFVPGCLGCQGYLCPLGCKNDSARICVVPAIAEHRARLVADCRVTRLEASRSRITGVVCQLRGGATRTLRGEIIALAAGALQSPTLLLRSASSEWPDGLANASGMVGRNLMRHCIDLYAIKLPDIGSGDFDNRQKQLAFNDFYDGAGGKLGSVQSFGRLPPRRMMFASLIDDVRHSRFAAVTPLLRKTEPLIRPALDALEHRRMVFAATLEDLPYADNRVTAKWDGADNTTVQIRYRVSPHERRRVSALRHALAHSFRALSYQLLKQAENNQRLAHACGTCRFGDSPRNSVLDAGNRAHGLDNLYVVDASFFPSSGGTNPSLTIAANALRVANLLNG